MAGFYVRPLSGTPLWAISAPYWSPKLNSAAKGVPGTHWDSAVRAHIGYPDAIQLVVEKLREMGLKSDDGPVRDPTYAHNLPASYADARGYQKTGIDFAVANSGSGALLADEMGLGKGLQAVRALRALRRKNIVVCPAHVRGVWERPADRDVPRQFWGEFAKWWDGAVLMRPYGLTPEPIPADADVVVIHYDIVHAWVAVLLEWFNGGSIVFDEAHVLLNATSRRSKACRELARAAAGRLALTGTPPTDRVKDLYNIVDTISPERFGDFFPFGKRYCDAKKVDVRGPGGTTKTVYDFGGRSNIPELRKRLDWFTLRRTKREVMSELPALTRQIVDVEVSANRRVSISARIAGDKKRMRAALDSAADGKLKHVVALVRSHLEEGQRVVVGTYRRSVCEQIADTMNEIAPTRFIHGGVALTKRGAIVDKLRNVEGPCCLVANIDCASTGIDLTFASKIVMAELVWEPRDLIQYEARAHRFGAKDPVLVQYVIARGTGDELILHAVIGKLDNFLDLVENDAGDGLKADLDRKDEGLSRLTAALKKMGEAEVRAEKRAAKPSTPATKGKAK